MMAREIEGEVGRGEWLERARKSWLSSAETGNLWLLPDFDELLVTEERREVVLWLARRVVAEIRGWGESVDTEVLARMKLGGPGWSRGMMSTDVFRGVGETVVRMLE